MKRHKMNSERKHLIVPGKEPFVCEHCGEEVMGGRYVNHCPRCLWSKHVDQEIPGDRASSCRGLMEPVGATQKHGKWRIVHECTKCGIERTVDAAHEDNSEKIIELTQRPLIERKRKKA